MLHPAQIDEARLLRDCQLRRQRRSGPGGQHRNKVETAVVITHVPSGIQGEASERRSQEQNRRVALFRLRVNLALGVRRAAGGDAPSTLWRDRCRGGRVQVSAAHEDFPAMLAEALDAVHQRGGDVKQAAAWLSCSMSQLVKLLQDEPRAMEQVNRQRQAAGLRPLR